MVDYLITSPSVFDSIPYFKIGNFLPWFSDHCPVFFTLEIKNRPPDSTPQESNKTKAPKQYIWSENSKSSYLEMISSPEFEERLDKCVEVDHSDPNLLVNYVTDVLTDAAKKAKINVRKYNSMNDPPWFDKSCRDLKNDIKRLGTKIRNSQKDKPLKSELYTKKKELKKLIQKNKSNFKNDLMEQIKQSKGDSKKFWKLLDRIEQKLSLIHISEPTRPY